MNSPRHRRAIEPRLLLAAPLVAALLQAACIAGGPGSSFDRTLKVDGPVRMDVTAGSGKVVVRGSSPGVVHIRGEVRAGGFILESRARRIEQISSDPPIDQVGNSIHIGRRSDEAIFSWVTIDYIIETPEATELRVKNGSGSIEVSGLKEPLSLTTGSGSVRLESAGDDVSLTIGSGSAHISHVEGSVNFQAGSGTLSLEDVREEIRGTSGSGNIHVDRAQGRVSVQTGSGEIRVGGATHDVRAGTSSGSLDLRGNPNPDAFWDLGTRSGRLTITVPSNAGFSLNAHTSSGRVEAGLPIMIEEQSRRVLRARVGDGRAHVNLQTSSGNIHIVQGGAS